MTHKTAELNSSKTVIMAITMVSTDSGHVRYIWIFTFSKFLLIIKLSARKSAAGETKAVMCKNEKA